MGEIDGTSTKISISDEERVMLQARGMTFDEVVEQGVYDARDLCGDGGDLRCEMRSASVGVGEIAINCTFYGCPMRYRYEGEVKQGSATFLAAQNVLSRLESLNEAYEEVVQATTRFKEA
jgi:hypothetical protein